MKIKDRIKELLELIKHHDDLYWNKNKPIISDDEYDALVSEYNALIKLDDSDELYVPGFLTSGSQGVKILEPMLSLAKFNDIDDAEKRIAKLGGNVTIEDKYDGNAARLIYEDGNITRVHTRGNGIIGDDISHRLYLISGIPSTIPSSDEHNSITGEIVTQKVAYEYWCKTHEVPVTRDSRAIIAGMLRRLEPRDDEDLPLFFIPYHGSKSIRDKCKDYPDMIELFRKWGFEYLPDSYSSIPKDKPDSIFHTDGVVFKDNNLSSWDNQETIGYYTYGGCFKYPTELAQTKVTGVTWGLTTQGELIGVLNFEPTLLTNKVASKCKFNYPVEYIKQGINVGSKITFTIANEIIPHMVSLDVLGDGDPIKFPKECPQCDETLNTENEIPCCTNPQCPGLLANRLERLLGKKGLDIQGLGEKKIALLVESDVLIYPYQLFQLEEEDLLGLNFNKKLARSIISSIEKVKELPLATWLYGLAIPRLGLSRCIEIQSYMKEYKFDNTEQLLELLTNQDTMCGMFGIDGIKVASYVRSDYENIYSFLDNYDYSKQLDNLIDLKPVVLTGSWIMTKDKLGVLLKEKGFLLCGTVTRSTYKLMIGLKPSANKVQLAERYEIPSFDITAMSIDEIIATLEK